MKINSTCAILTIAITNLFFTTISHAQEQTTSQNMRKAIVPGKSFSAAIEAGDYVFLSGVIGTDADKKSAANGVKIEAQRIMESLGKTLSLSGLGMQDIVKMTVFLRKAEDFSAMNSVYQSYFPSNPPARTTVIVGFPDKAVNIEIDAIAYRNNSVITTDNTSISDKKSPVVFMRAGDPPKYNALESLPKEQLSPLISRQYLHGTQSTFVRWEMKKGAIIPEHKHPNEQITWITKGRAEVEVEGKQYIMRAGDMIIIPPNMRHKFTFTEDTIDIDFFSPRRQDWIDGSATYLPQ
ncbi:MAG: Rid family hydrolase [Glaciimonas sp.]|nr:Rid family hydrolase [Glaciimonas sp.]